MLPQQTSTTQKRNILGAKALNSLQKSDAEHPYQLKNSKLKPSDTDLAQTTTRLHEAVSFERLNTLLQHV